MSKGRKQAPQSESSLGLYVSSMTAVVVTLWFQTKTQDPFNLPKFEALILLAPLSFYFIKFRVNNNLDAAKFRWVLISVVFFLAAFLSAALTSDNIYQSMVGMYQRNLGFLTYFFYAILFLAILLNLTFNNCRKLLIIFVSLGTLQTLYGFIQYAGLDPVAWKNPYSPIIGTFGNPNYQSAFLGATGVAALALLLLSNRYLKAFLLIQMSASLFLILVSNSIQGFMAFGLTTSVMTVLLIRISKPKFLAPAILIFLVGAALGILGILNKGPASFLYQTSISARGDYWRAGLAMLKAHPVNGVGIEQFGGYFAFYRDLNQVRNRSYATYSDNAHNAFIHFGATGGFPLLLGSLLLWTIVLVLGFNSVRKLIGFQAQALSFFIAIFIGLVSISLISPENLGFTVWSWIFAGAIAALSLQQEDKTQKQTKISSRSSDKLIWLFAILLIITSPAGYLAHSVYQADQGIYKSYRMAYGGQGTLKELLISIDNVVSQAPLEQRYKALASSMSLGLDQNSLARDYANSVLEINPRSIDAYKIIAMSYERESNFNEAISARLNYLKFDRYNLENLDKLARNNFALGKKADALAYLANMKRIQAENPLVTALIKDLNP